MQDPTLPPPQAKPGNWFDKQALAYATWMFWVHLIICQCPGFIVGLLFLAGCSTPEGKAVGVKLLKFSLLGVVVAFVIRLVLASATA